jgi:acetyl-CoA acetyltransferase
MGPPILFTIPVLRYMKTYKLMHEQLAMVSVVQREWAAKNPRATFKTPITVEDVHNQRIAPAQIPGAKISVCHVGGMFAASGTIIMSNELPSESPG